MDRPAEPALTDTAKPIVWLFDGVSGLAALAAVAMMPFREGEQTVLLLVNAGLIVALLALRRVTSVALPSRPVHAVPLMIALAQIQPVTLIMACLLEGDPGYRTAAGAFSHLERSIRVAGATFVLFGAMAVASVLVGGLHKAARRAGTRADAEWTSFLGAIDDDDLVLLQILGTALFVAQLALLFDQSATVINRSLGFVYAVQVGVGAMHGAALFVGVALRRRHHTARVAFGVVAAGALLMVVGGNRFSAILALLEISAGYSLAGEIPRRRLVALAAAVGFATFVALIAGDVLRADGGGRSGQVALQRLTEIVSGQRSTGDIDNETVRLTTLHRLLRNTSHTIIARIPETSPFDPAGVESMPAEFVDTFVPGTLRDSSWKPELRAMFLREFGYVIDETTAVEFSLLGDAWYRGGWLALVVVGLVVGVALQLAEAYAYRGDPREQALKVVTLLAAVHHMEGRDVIFGIRRLILMSATASVTLMLMRVAGRREPRRQPAPAD